jgi:hypothetical protein
MRLSFAHAGVLMMASCSAAFGDAIPYPAASPDEVTHIYATPYSGTLFRGIPAGTFIGAETLPVPGSDLNYSDDLFMDPANHETPLTDFFDLLTPALVPPRTT